MSKSQRPLNMDKNKDLQQILENLDFDSYNSRIEAVSRNYDLVMKEYLQPDDNLYELVMNYESEKGSA